MRKLRSTELKLDPQKSSTLIYEKKISDFADQAISDYVKDRITLLVGSESIAFPFAQWYVPWGWSSLKQSQKKYSIWKKLKTERYKKVESCIRKSTENFVYGIDGVQRHMLMNT